MANEAVLIYETVVPLPFTVADGTGIEKGSLLMLSDPYTASAVTSSGAAFAGVAAEEKIASDGKTKLALYRGGIFKFTLSGACTAGDSLGVTFSNKVQRMNVVDEQVVGVALETATDGETLLVEVRPMHVNQTGN